jgi:hypothetical protein
MDAGRTNVGMGLTPNGNNAVLASPAQGRCAGSQRVAQPRGRRVSSSSPLSPGGPRPSVSHVQLVLLELADLLLQCPHFPL